MESSKSQSFREKAQDNFPVTGIISGNCKVGGSVKISARGAGTAGIISHGLQVGNDVTHNLIASGNGTNKMPVGSFVTGNEVIGGTKQVNMTFQQLPSIPALSAGDLSSLEGGSISKERYCQRNQEQGPSSPTPVPKQSGFSSQGFVRSVRKVANNQEWTPLPERIHKQGGNYSILVSGTDMWTNGNVDSDSEEDNSSEMDDSSQRIPEKRNRFHNTSAQEQDKEMRGSSGETSRESSGNSNLKMISSFNSSSTKNKRDEGKRMDFQDVFAKYQQFLDSGTTVGTFVGGNSTVGTEVHNSPYGTIPGTKIIGNVTMGNKKVGTFVNNSAVPGYTTNFVGQDWDAQVETHFDDPGTEAKPAIGKYKSGLVLMINNKFDSPLEDLPDYVSKEHYVQWERKGAEKDKDLVAKTFLELTGNRVGYIPNVRNSDALIAYLDKFKQAIKKMEPDYVVIIVSTHGMDHNHLLMDDLSTADLYEDILYQFGTDKFPQFTKPVILLIQACQRGPDFNDDLYNSVTYKFKNLNISTRSGKSTSVSPDDMQRASASENSSSQPEKLQFFIGMSTLPNKVAYRDHTKGSFYIQAISSQFCKEETLAKLFRKVDGQVERLCGEAGVKQNTSIIKSPDFPEDFCF